MPFWGLVITSIGFTIPSVLAFCRRKKKMGTICAILSGTSVLYHGTHKMLFKIIDLTYAHSVGCFYVFDSIRRCFIYHRIYDFVICTGTFSSVLVFYKGTCNKKLEIMMQNKFHMLFHIITQTMMSLHAIDKK
jgi:hypothetical protein